MVTAIVTCCRRLHNVPRIREALRAQTRPCGAVWLFYNGEDALGRGDLAAFDRVVRSSEPADYYTRYAVALCAGSEFVLLLDDDCVPGPRWVERCLAAARERDGIFAPAGWRVTRADFAAGPYARDGDVGRPVRPHEDRAVEVDVPFHSYFLRRRHLAWLFHEPVGVGLRGGERVPIRGQDDVLLACRAWRHARVRCWLPSVPEPGARGADGEVEERTHASWLHRPGFGEERLAALRLEASLGWRPLLARSGWRAWRARMAAQRAG